MIVDTSAIIAILRDEPERDALLIQLSSAMNRSISTASYLETSIVINRTGKSRLHHAFMALIEEFDFAVESVTRQQAIIASQAHVAYGKGSGHPAQLNFGDCFAYALAIEKNEPLLSRGMISTTPMSAWRSLTASDDGRVTVGVPFRIFGDDRIE